MMLSNKVEEDFSALKQRYEIMDGDKRAYYESSQWAIKKNRETIDYLKQQNKELAEKLSRWKSTDTSSQTPLLSQRPTLSFTDKASSKILSLHKNLDEWDAAVQRRKNQIKKLQDQLKLMKEEVDISKKAFSQSPEAEVLRKLYSLISHSFNILLLTNKRKYVVWENKLDNVTIKFNEALSMRRIYEQMILIHRKEKINFDRQLEAFEKALNDKKKEVISLKLLSKDASKSHDSSKIELLKLETQVSEDTILREKILEQKREIAAKLQKELQQQREADARIFDEDKNNVASNQANAQTASITTDHQNKQQNSVENYDEVFRLLKDVTGISDLSDVVDKLCSQVSTTEHLQSLEASSKTRLADLLSEKERVVQEYENIKYQGDLRKSREDNVRTELEKHKIRVEENACVTRDNLERDASQLHLIKLSFNELLLKFDGSNAQPISSDLLTAYNVLLRNVTNLRSSLTKANIPSVLQPILDDYNLLLSFVSSPNRLSNYIMAANAAALQASNNAAPLTPVSEDALLNGANSPQSSAQLSAAPATAPSLAGLAVPSTNILPQYNTRINLKKLSDSRWEEDMGYGSSEDETIEIPDRDFFKKYTAQLLNTKNKGNKKEGGGKAKKAKKTGRATKGGSDDDN